MPVVVCYTMFVSVQGEVKVLTGGDGARPEVRDPLRRLTR